MQILRSIMLILCTLSTYVSDSFAQSQLENCSQPFTVMSFNIRREGTEKSSRNLWKNRKQLVFEIIKTADLVGLQEATPHQISDLKTALPHYDFVGTGRGAHYFGKSKNEHTTIAYNTQRFTLQQQGTFVISQGTKNPFKWKKKGKVPRIATWVKLHDKQANTDLYLYNTHLDHEYGKVKLAGLHNMVRDIQNRHLINNNIPVIITGDFNTALTPAVQNILAPIHTISVKDYAQCTKGPLDTFSGWTGRSLRLIDHILIAGNNPHFNIMQYEVVQEKNPNKRPSDHRPIMAVLQYK